MSPRKKRLYTAVVLAEISYGLFILVASLLAVRVIGSPFVLGLTGTVHVATRVLFNVAFGRLGDRIGYKTLMLAACGFKVAGYVCLGFGTPASIFVAYFLAGVGSAIFWPLAEAWIGHGKGDESLLRSMGTFGVCFTGGIALGNLCGGFIMQFAPLGPIVLGCALIAAVAGLIYQTPDREVVETPGAGASVADASSGAGVAARRRFMYAGWIANFATWSVIGIVRFLFNKLGAELGIPAAILGSINFVLYTCWMVMFLMLARSVSWPYRLPPLLACQALGAAALLALGLWPSQTMAFVVFGLFGCTAGMTWLSSSFYGQNGSMDRGTKSGLHEMIQGAGMLLGPFAGGALAEVFSLQTPFLFGAGLIVAAMCAELFVTGGRNGR